MCSVDHSFILSLIYLQFIVPSLVTSMRTHFWLWDSYSRGMWVLRTDILRAILKDEVTS